MQHDATGGGAFACARGGSAQTAFEMAAIFVGFAHKVPTTFRTFGHGQHIVVNELDQAPSPGNGQQGFDATRGNLF